MTADARVVRSEAAYLGLVKKVELAGDRIVDPRDAADVDVGVAFEAALEARRDVLEFQGVGEYLTGGSRFAVRRSAVRGSAAHGLRFDSRLDDSGTAVRSKKLARCSSRRRSATSCTCCSRAAGSRAIARRSSASGALRSVRHVTTDNP